ncbi:MAG: flagellar hook basal-body protein [Planctomycetota bacterium]
MTTYAEAALVSSLNYLSQSQQAIAHNLANISSTAFKRRQPIAEESPSRFHGMLREQLPTVKYREAADWSIGNLVPTGERNHVALESQDFFRVRDGEGNLFFTRSGELQVDAQGYLTDESGFHYLDNAGADLQVRAEGDSSTGFSVTPGGEIVDADTGVSTGRTLGVFRVGSREALQPAGRGRFVDTAKQDVVVVPTTAIRQGNVEASNVQTVSEMVNMLVVQRSFQATATILRNVGQLQSSFVSALAR